jgi:selenocysteine-specific translation elongation factor
MTSASVLVSRQEGPMASRRNDLTIDQLLQDPVTLAVMKADQVDAAALEAMLRRLAARLAVPPQSAAKLHAGRPAAAFPVSSAPADTGAAFDQCGAL